MTCVLSCSMCNSLHVDLLNIEMALAVTSDRAAYYNHFTATYCHPESAYLQASRPQNVQLTELGS